MTQLRMPGLDVPRPVRAAPGRGEPAVWVRRVCVMRALGDDLTDAFRDVTLRRGLNVVWAPAADARGGPGIAGHTAGKTSFCRLVRHALGEPHFAAERTRQRLRQVLPAAWLLAEVIVAGECWAVGRPFAIGAHPFAVRGATIEEAVASGERPDLAPYLQALDAATTAALPAARFPVSHAAITWAHVLPWLTRDQERRFADFDKWRHKASASGAPDLSDEERHFLMRSVLDLVSDAEAAELRRNADLVARKQERERQAPLFAHQAGVDERRITRLLDVPEPVGSALFASSARGEIARRLADLRERRARLTVARERDAATADHDSAVAAETNAARDRDTAAERLAWQRQELEALGDDLRGAQSVALVMRLQAGHTFCNALMTEANAARCPIAASRPADLTERIGVRTMQEQRDALARAVAYLEQEHARTEEVLARATACRQEANARRVRSMTAYDAAVGPLAAEEARLHDAERWVQAAEESRREAETAAAEVTRLTGEITDSYRRQDLLREQGRQALGHLSERFDHAIRALLGADVRGRVEPSGRSLALHVEQQGDRDSAAIATVKLLAFDLAALAAGVEGRGHHPRLLVHDGPREADLALGVYTRLFAYARELEACFDGEPGFQYIVTTTTDPPEDVLTLPWLRLKLSGADRDDRLYRTDL